MKIRATIFELNTSNGFFYFILFYVHQVGLIWTNYKETPTQAHTLESTYSITPHPVNVFLLTLVLM